MNWGQTGCSFHDLSCRSLFLKYSPRFAWGGRPHRRLFWPTQTYIQKIKQKQCFQGSGIKKKFNAVISPNPWKHSYLHWFLQFFHVPMPLANSNIYTKNRSKTLFFAVFYIFVRQKRRNLHVFRLKVGPKHWFLQCFQCSGIQKQFKISLFTVFFHFCPFFPCRKPTKMTQNSVTIPS